MTWAWPFVAAKKIVEDKRRKRISRSFKEALKSVPTLLDREKFTVLPPGRPTKATSVPVVQTTRRQIVNSP